MIARLTLYWFDNLHVIFQLDAFFFSGLRLGSTVSVDLRPETVRKAMGGSPRVREDPLGTPPPLSLPRKSSENLEEVPRIWEGEGYWRSEILNPTNNEPN